jgi:quercetin dioxygenase-like cupin family protein
VRRIFRRLAQAALAVALAVSLAYATIALAAHWDLPILTEAGGTAFAAGQRTPPAQTIGQTEQLLRSLDLTGELASGKGRPLRMRRITVQPGGALALHNHVDRPAVTYMLQGEMTYHQQGRPDVVVRPGDGFAEGRTTTHWAENTGKVPAVWIAVDIPKP